MQISRDEAAQALSDINDARSRIDKLHDYSDSSPFLILWGLVWLAANSATQFAPALADMAWLAGILVGTTLTIVLATVQAKRRGVRDASQSGQSAQVAIRMGVSVGVVLAFFSAMMTIAWPLDDRQFNALISLFWACAYMGVGVWIGMRLFWIGAITAVAVLFGYFNIEEYYSLWMGIAGGGSLIAGGLWLRRV